jgi:hypothetical protein
MQRNMRTSRQWYAHMSEPCQENSPRFDFWGYTYIISRIRNTHGQVSGIPSNLYHIPKKIKRNKSCNYMLHAMDARKAFGSEWKESRAYVAGKARKAYHIQCDPGALCDRRGREY